MLCILKYLDSTAVMTDARLGFVTTPLPRLSSPLSPVSALFSSFPVTSCVLSREAYGRFLTHAVWYSRNTVVIAMLVFGAGNVASWQWTCLPCPWYHKEIKNTPEIAKNSRTCAHKQNSVFPLPSMWVFPVWGKKLLLCRKLVMTEAITEDRELMDLDGFCICSAVCGAVWITQRFT